MRRGANRRTGNITVDAHIARTVQVQVPLERKGFSGGEVKGGNNVLSRRWQLFFSVSDGHPFHAAAKGIDFFQEVLHAE